MIAMCDSLCCCVDDAKKEPRISPDIIKGDADVSKKEPRPDFFNKLGTRTRNIMKISNSFLFYKIFIFYFFYYFCLMSNNSVISFPRPQNNLKIFSFHAFPTFPFFSTFHLIKIFPLTNFSLSQSTRSRDSAVPVNRKCTDVFFLILNIAFVITLVSLLHQSRLKCY